MLTMEMVLHKDVDFAPKFGKNQIQGMGHEASRNHRSYSHRSSHPNLQIPRVPSYQVL